MDKNWKSVWIKKGDKKDELHRMDGWDHLTKENWDEFLYNSFNPVFETLKNSKDIMEMGCGAGASLKFIKERFPKINLNGFDYSETLVNTCSENLDGNFWVDNAENEIWKNNDKYDFVFNVGTFIYFSSEDSSISVIKKMIDISKSGKVLLVDISDKDKEESAKSLRKRTHKGELEHLYLRKDLFENFAKNNSCRVTFFNQIDICPKDWNLSATYRFNVLIEKI